MHLDQEQVQRLAHRELTSPAETFVREHLASCETCRRQLADLEREERLVQTLLQLVDHEPPPVHVRDVARRARVRGGRPLRWAAGVILAVSAAGAAYAAPGSPLPRWVDATVRWLGGSVRPAPDLPVVDTPALSGISIAPGADLVIRFTSPDAGGSARITFSDGAEVVIRGPVDAATFTSEIDRVVIENRPVAATYEIAVPRGAPRVEIRVGASRVLLKEGLRITTNATADAAGLYVIPLAPPRQ